MTKYLILCVDDEREVLDSVLQDLIPFEDNFVVEGAQSVTEAKQVIEELAEDGVQLALILCDHIMPEQTGISFLIELSQNSHTKAARKLLLTGQADLEDTVEAVNHASLDYYIAKPWTGKELRETLVAQLTTFMIENDEDLLSWTTILDSETILNAMAARRSSFGE
ncbi:MULTISPECIES: response regulator [Vibrio]|jgi:CheY-like chemotaxis protein|uniref:response regulator n=1 Tax=Vibrio TaxID=662 RepID=UPI000BFFAA2A|nr:MULTISPECIES: response regulator [unclassified Vibrio]PHJ42544.1 chemotaxis protein CheY [Vibrio sp. PID17_43]RIZ56624.1 chemotaxis protein CheY [Vibrio sp. PID23_8]